MIAVGPGRFSDDGTRIPMELAEGDRVIVFAQPSAIAKVAGMFS